MTAKPLPDFKAIARRHARMRRVLWVLAALAIIGGFVLYMEWPTLLILRVERTRNIAAAKLLSYTIPPGQIVYDDNNADAAKLLQQGGYEKEGAWRGLFFVPPPLVADGAAVGREIHCRGAVYMAAVSAGGQRLLLLVDIKREYGENDRWIMLQPHFYMRVRSTDEQLPFAWQEVGASSALTITLRANDTLILHAGLADAKDPSHFTIDGLVNGQLAFTCDGTIDAANNKVHLIARRGSGVDLTPLARPGD